MKKSIKIVISVIVGILVPIIVYILFTTYFAYPYDLYIGHAYVTGPYFINAIHIDNDNVNLEIKNQIGPEYLLKVVNITNAKTYYYHTILKKMNIMESNCNANVTSTNQTIYLSKIKCTNLKSKNHLDGTIMIYYTINGSDDIYNSTGPLLFQSS